MLLQYLLDEPQRLIDDQTQFRLQCPAGTFTVVLEDGWAAGGPWLLFRFLDGPYKGQALWMAGWDPIHGYQYLARASDDGFLFNWPGKNEDAVPGGAYLPDLHGTIFYPLAEG